MTKNIFCDCFFYLDFKEDHLDLFLNEDDDCNQIEFENINKYDEFFNSYFEENKDQFIVDFHDENDLLLSFEEISVITSVAEGDITIYNGPYTVIPKTSSQTLETSQKQMINNITVYSIPYYEVSNSSGKTVYIGSEVETNG